MDKKFSQPFERFVLNFVKKYYDLDGERKASKHTKLMNSDEVLLR